MLTSQLAAEQPSRVTELIRAADAARLARAARRTPTWPLQVAAALRESLRRPEGPGRQARSWRHCRLLRLMSRVQLALNVDDIEEAVAFYSRLFDAEPAKRRPGYANFAARRAGAQAGADRERRAGRLAQPPRRRGATPAEVVDATRRLTAAGLPTRVEDGTTCCYALQDKVWVTGPGGERWEVYTVLADAPDARGEVIAMDDCCESGCCDSTSCC